MKIFNLKNTIGVLLSTMLLMSSASAINADEIDDTSFTSYEISEEGTVSQSSFSNTRLFSYTLNNTECQYQMSVSGGSYGRSYDLYTIPVGGNVTIYIKSARWNGTTLYSRFFDVGAHGPALEFSVPQGSTYYIFIQASTASASAPTTGEVKY